MEDPRGSDRVQAADPTRISGNGLKPDSYPPRQTGRSTSRYPDFDEADDGLWFGWWWPG